MAGQNSTITLQTLVDDAQSMGDLAPALPTGGFAEQPALSIADDVMSAMLLGGEMGQPFNWKWNRTNVPPFPTISWQQDYFVPGVTNVGWIESAWAVHVNSTSNLKPKRPVEVHRDLMVTDGTTGTPGKICWIPNDQAITGTWGVAPLGPTASNPSGQSAVNTSLSGLMNPGPNVVYTNPVGTLNQPLNPTTCIQDAFGNLWTVTTFGTCGVVNPFATNLNPVYPTPTSPSTVATTATDGTVVWTAVNPKGQAFRLNPIPPQTGLTWLIQVVAQMRVPKFTSLGQFIEPVPDDFSTYFKQGFFAQCYRRNPDAKVRARFADEWKMWLRALQLAIKQGQREMDDVGFYPSSSIMDTGSGFGTPSPAQPYGPII